MKDARVKNHISSSISMIVLLVLLTSCTNVPYYFVSPSGSNQFGDGSFARPWRDIQYAIDKLASFTGPAVPHLVIRAGTYGETLTIKNSISIEAARIFKPPFGTEPVPVTITPDPAKQGPDFQTDLHIDISCKCQVTLQGLTFDGVTATRIGISVSGAYVDFDEIEVKNIGNYGIQMKQSPLFRITSSKVSVGTGPYRYFADIGINVESSSGVITSLTAGNYFDHIISIVDSTVEIRNSDLTGSTIYYADGIRTYWSRVTIENNRIIRPSGAQPPDTQPSVENRSYAGVDVWSFPGRGSVQNRLVVIRNNIIEGFNYGIALTVEGDRVKVEGNRLSRNVTADVGTDVASTRPTTAYPILDFGGGALGNRGGNSFLGGQYAFLHQGLYDVPAYGNTWGVDPWEVEDRINDKFDNSQLGKVKACRRWTPFGFYTRFSRCTGL